MRLRIPVGAAGRRGRGLALAALLLSLLGSFNMKAQEMAAQSAPQGDAEATCLANLKRIFKLTKSYEHEFGAVLGFPTDLVANIAPMTHREMLLTCPADPQRAADAKGGARTISYRYVNDARKPSLSKTPRGLIAIVAEERANHDGKRLVLFYDGAVRAFDEKQFEALKNNDFLDTPPAVKNH